MGNQWSSDDIPDLTGKNVIVTGGNRGLGYASVLEFASKGAHVILTSRSKEKGETAIAEIQKSVPNMSGSIETMVLDLSSFKSVRAFADNYKEKYNNKLDVLLNNAGMSGMDMKRTETEDGHESLWQTNVWSACLLSQLLLPLLASSGTKESPARIVFVSSVTAGGENVKINIDNLENEGDIGDKERAYYEKNRDQLGLEGDSKDWYNSYANTKCADWMISNALSKRFHESSDERIKDCVFCTCAHPGFSSTEMTAIVGGLMNALLGQPASEGCLPQVRVAVDPTVPSGSFYGPNTSTKLSFQHLFKNFKIVGMGGDNPEPEFYGSPVPSAMVSPFANDKELCEKLLEKAEEIIGAKFVLV